jgi:hypothetical protein
MLKTRRSDPAGSFVYWLFLVLDYEIMLVFGGAAEQVEVP